MALVGPAVPAATASPSVPADTDAGIALTCWYDYSFDLVNTTVYASAFKDCPHLEEPQPLGFSVQVLVGNYWSPTPLAPATSSPAVHNGH